MAYFAYIYVFHQTTLPRSFAEFVYRQLWYGARRENNNTANYVTSGATNEVGNLQSDAQSFRTLVSFQSLGSCKNCFEKDRTKAKLSKNESK